MISASTFPAKMCPRERTATTKGPTSASPDVIHSRGVARPRPRVAENVQILVVIVPHQHKDGGDAGILVLYQEACLNASVSKVCSKNCPKRSSPTFPTKPDVIPSHRKATAALAGTPPVPYKSQGRFQGFISYL